MKNKLFDHLTNDLRDVLMDMVDDGLLNSRDVLVMCLKYMTERDILDMICMNEINTNLEE